MLALDPGKLTRRGTIQQEVVTRGASGEVLKSWSDVATVWFAMLNQSGREVVTAREVMPEMTHTIQIRYRSGVTPQMRFAYGSRLFDILSVRDPEEAHEALLLDCKEGRSQGS